MVETKDVSRLLRPDIIPATFHPFTSRKFGNQNRLISPVSPCPIISVSIHEVGRAGQDSFLESTWQLNSFQQLLIHDEADKRKNVPFLLSNFSLVSTDSASYMACKHEMPSIRVTIPGMQRKLVLK